MLWGAEKFGNKWSVTYTSFPSFPFTFFWSQSRNIWKQSAARVLQAQQIGPSRTWETGRKESWKRQGREEANTSLSTLTITEGNRAEDFKRSGNFIFFRRKFFSTSYYCKIRDGSCEEVVVIKHIHNEKPFWFLSAFSLSYRDTINTCMQTMDFSPGGLPEKLKISFNLLSLCWEAVISSVNKKWPTHTISEIWVRLQKCLMPGLIFAMIFYQRSSLEKSEGPLPGNKP